MRAWYISAMQCARQKVGDFDLILALSKKVLKRKKKKLQHFIQVDFNLRSLPK